MASIARLPIPTMPQAHAASMAREQTRFPNFWQKLVLGWWPPITLLSSVDLLNSGADYSLASAATLQSSQFGRTYHGTTSGGTTIKDRYNADGAGSPLTVVILLQPDNDEGPGNFILKIGGGDDSYRLFWVSNENVHWECHTGSSNTDAVIGDGILNQAGDWILCAGDYDNSDDGMLFRIIYPPGTLMTSDTASLGGPLNNTSHDIEVGDFDGKIAFFWFMETTADHR